MDVTTIIAGTVAPAVIAGLSYLFTRWHQADGPMRQAVAFQKEQSEYQQNQIRELQQKIKDLNEHIEAQGQEILDLKRQLRQKQDPT